MTTSDPARMHLPTAREDWEATILDRMQDLGRLAQMSEEDRAETFGRLRELDLARVAHWLNRCIETLEV